MSRRGWFELSDDGWRNLATSRPIGRLLLEAVQNAFDENAAHVQVGLSESAISVEDNGLVGFEDDRLIYTLFLSTKRDDPECRGRIGRGLKELIAAVDSATVETAVSTVQFDENGRIRLPNSRTDGTRITLRRSFTPEELAEARRLLQLCIPPKGTRLIVDRETLKRPQLFLSLTGELESIAVERGVERAETATTTIALYTPNDGCTPHLFEMGVPIAAWEVPWHVDVGQRVPLIQGRDGVPERFRLQVQATLLEAMVHSYLNRKELKANWVHEVIGRWPLSSSVLDAYCSRAFPRGAILGGTRRANDRAKQLGAHVIDVSAVPHKTYLTLGRVLEYADDYVRRRSIEFLGEDVDPTESQLRFAAAVRWLARRIAGRVVRIRFFARDPNDAGLIEDATTDPDARIISFNVRGPLCFEDILEPTTLGVVLHEMAHLETPEHGHRFIDRLQFLSGQMVKLVIEADAGFADRLRAGDPDTSRET